MINNKQLEKSFSVIVAKVLDFVDDKVNNASAYDKRVLRDSIYTVRDNLISEINATELENYDTEEYNN